MPNVYGMQLKERFEAASLDFVTTYSRKARLDRAGRRPYSASEFIDDLYGAAGNHGLFAEALWAYFRMLYAEWRRFSAGGRYHMYTMGSGALAKRVFLVVCLFYLALVYTALAVRGLSGPSGDEEVFAACGYLVEGHSTAVGWRKDCGIFAGYHGPPVDPFHESPHMRRLVVWVVVLTHATDSETGWMRYLFTTQNTIMHKKFRVRSAKVIQRVSTQANRRVSVSMHFTPPG
jgi:hypothetical protein